MGKILDLPAKEIYGSCDCGGFLFMFRLNPGDESTIIGVECANCKSEVELEFDPGFDISCWIDTD